MKDTGTKILIAVATLIPAGVLFYFMTQNRPPGVDREAEREKEEVVVLGRDLAEARAKEKERLERLGKETKSPLPEGSYEMRQGEYGLLNATQQDFDLALREFCAGFANETPAGREALREKIPMGDFYTLMTFADRSSLFALREKDPAILRAGLSAIAMIDGERSDFRDTLMSIAMLNHCAGRLDLDVTAEFDAAAALAEPATAELLREFVKREPESKSLENSWGYREVELESGVGFVSAGFAKYEPQHDLLALGIGIADAIDADALYQANSVAIAGDLPPVWLGGDDHPRVKEIVSKANAGVTVNATAVEGAKQMFVVFTVELDSPESAQALLEISQQVQRKQDTAMLGFAKEKIFSLIVARPARQGVEPLEKGDSLERFAAPIGKALMGLEKLGGE